MVIVEVAFQKIAMPEGLRLQDMSSLEEDGFGSRLSLMAALE